MRGAFVAPATEHIQVVGGTGATDPMIGSTVGGLSPIFAMATGVTSNVVSLARTEALLRTLSFTSTTARGTILDEIYFDPWSVTCVNTAAVLYGAVHKQFEGSVNISYETVSNSTLMGRIGAAYIPSVYPKDLVVTPENLYLFDHAIMDVSASGKGTFTMKPTTADSFVVRKDDGKFYGKLVLLAFTDIANAYGTTMNIPLNVYSKLGPDAHYSAFLPSIIPTVPEEVRAEVGFLPTFPKTLNATLITENREALDYDMLDTLDLEHVVRDTTNGNQWDAVRKSSSTTNFFAEALWGAVANVSWNNADFATSITQMISGLSQLSNGGFIDDMIKSTVMNKKGQVEKDDELAAYVAAPVENPTTAGLTVPDIWSVNSLYHGFTTDIEYETSVGLKTRQAGYVPIAGGEEVLVDVEMRPKQTGSSKSLCFNQQGRMVEAYSTYYDSTTPVPLDAGNRFVFKPATFKPDDLLVKSGRLQKTVVAPLGYTAIRLVDNGASIPAVQPGVVGETMPYGAEQIHFMTGVITYLKRNPATKSVTYTINYTNGDLIADVLVNKYGMWTSSTGLDVYALFLGELSYSVEQVTRNTVEWAKLKSITGSYWNTRLFTARGVRRVGNRVLNNVQPEMLASILGGAAMGVGSSLGDIGERKFLKKMQEARFKNQIELMKGKNKLAEADYRRKFGSQKAMVESEQSRAFRGPGSAEELADASPFNPSWDTELKAKPGLYSAVAPHKPNDAAVPPPAALTNVTHGTDTSFPPPPAHLANVTHGHDPNFPLPPPEGDAVNYEDLPGKSPELETFMDKMASEDGVYRAKYVPAKPPRPSKGLPAGEGADGVYRANYKPATPPRASKGETYPRTKLPPIEEKTEPPQPHPMTTSPDYKVKPYRQEGKAASVYSKPPPKPHQAHEMSYFMMRRDKNQKVEL